MFGQIAHWYERVPCIHEVVGFSPRPTFYVESKNLSSKWISYISVNSAIHSWLPKQIETQKLCVATDEDCSPKLALSEDGSRGHIES